MSTKKTLKRIALAAVSALGFGLMSVAPANAAALDWSVTSATASGGTATAATATQLAGTFNFVGASLATVAGTNYVVTVTGGTASSGSAISGNGTGTLVVQSAGASALFTIPTPTVGTITLSTYAFSGGVLATTATSTLTITVINASSLLLSSVAVYGVANAGACTTATAATTVNYLSKSDAGGNATLCVITKDGTGAAMGSVTVAVASNGIGNVGGAAVASGTSAAGITTFGLSGNGLSGASKYTVSATAGGVTLTGSLDVKFYDSVATVTLTQTGFAAGASNGSTAFATYKAADKNGFPVVLTPAGGEGSFSVSSDRTGGGTATAINEDKSLMSFSAAANAVSALGVETAGILSVATSATLEKASVRFGVGTILSNSVDYYASGAAATGTVSAADALPGTQQNVTATYVDSAGRPVADGTVVAFTATGGTIAASANTSNGKATAAFSSPIVGGLKTTINATTGGIAASKEISVSGGALQDALDAASDAALEAIDAANAATDAAQLAVDAADAATVAAEEARDAAEAATAAVEALAAQVSEMIADLKTQLTALANTVAKIAKKVKA